MAIYDWQHPQTQAATSYDCGYCGNRVGPNKGWKATNASGVKILICSHCTKPTFFAKDGRQWPGAAYGAPVEGLPTDVAAIYDEARRCMSISAYNTTVMACRKLLMHIAVEKGADGNKSFKYYVDWLIANHYVPPGGGAWADHIRDKGNDANHEIDLLAREGAEQVVSFTEMLLKFVYEMPARVAPPPTS